MNRRDFVISSGYAEVCTHCGAHRRPLKRRSHRTRRAIGIALDILLACAVGIALSAILFIGLSGGFRP